MNTSIEEYRAMLLAQGVEPATDRIAFETMTAEQYRQLMGVSSGQNSKQKQKPKKPQNPTPTESVEQQRLMRWVEFVSKRQHPELKLLYHIPNEGKRSLATGGKLRAEGLKSGVPDLCLPVPRGKYHGLYIELKRIKGGRVSDEQRQWISDLQAVGHRAVVCKGWKAAQAEIEWYLNL